MIHPCFQIVCLNSSLKYNMQHTRIHFHCVMFAFDEFQFKVGNLNTYKLYFNEFFLIDNINFLICIFND